MVAGGFMTKMPVPDLECAAQGSIV